MNLRYAEKYTERETKRSERTWGDFKTEDEGETPDQTTENSGFSQESEYKPHLPSQLLQVKAIGLEQFLTVPVNIYQILNFSKIIFLFSFTIRLLFVF